MIEDDVYLTHFYAMLYHYYWLSCKTCYGMFLNLLFDYCKCLLNIREAIASANVFKYLGIC
jgi:hypothetical protein